MGVAFMVPDEAAADRSPPNDPGDLGSDGSGDSFCGYPMTIKLLVVVGGSLAMWGLIVTIGSWAIHLVR